MGKQNTPSLMEPFKLLFMLTINCLVQFAQKTGVTPLIIYVETKKMFKCHYTQTMMLLNFSNLKKEDFGKALSLHSSLK